jgi:hypothetical protein
MKNEAKIIKITTIACLILTTRDIMDSRNKEQSLVAPIKINNKYIQTMLEQVGNIH